MLRRLTYGMGPVVRSISLSLSNKLSGEEGEELAISPEQKNEVINSESVLNESSNYPCNSANIVL